ncbi:MAG: pyruvate synthase subunit PorD [Candidatus Nezhaarchaeota archaeon]|nr:pyruvate synthase subunit PorD [Candidatus Nezhaarchaeota archaeon]MCX8141460.1 pyruvate synthase subunit PorD [Candidatus Nezhaarchaeota archaeon]MDW8049726.1 pyruvate synthase subunit PorD [Nitrososphaerota archaeon]
MGCVIREPGSSVRNRTASWRVFAPNVDRSKCVKCLLCWVFCPEGAIEIDEDGFTKVNYTYCKGCGICANECPPKAITMVK